VQESDLEYLTVKNETQVLFN